MKRLAESRLSGILVILLLYFSWCCKTVAYSNRLVLLFGFVGSIAALCLYISMIRLKNNDGRFVISEAINISFAVICLLIAIGAMRDSILIPASEKTIKILMGGLMMDPANLFISVEAFIWCIVLLYFTLRYHIPGYTGIKNCFALIRAKIFGLIRTYKWLLILLLITGVLCIDPDWYQFKWDGLLYYLACRSLNLSSISNLAVYGHIAQRSGVIMKLFEYVIPDTAHALFCANIFLLLTGTVYCYRTLALLFGKDKTVLCLLGTAVFAFSPYYLGMVVYYSLDYVLMCVLPMVIYYALNREWTGYMISSMVFCFTKEPAIIIYGGLCVGIVICDLIMGRVRPSAVFKTIRYYYMMLPGILWLITYKLLGPWSAGNSHVGFEGEYAVKKLSVLYVLNFGWLFLIMSVLSVLLITVRHLWKKKDTEILVPIGVSLAFFTLFSLIFNTVNHPRYVDSAPYMLYFVTLYLLYRAFSDGIAAKIITGVTAVILLISCYRTIDPISLAVFEHENTGGAKIILTSDAYGDGSIYNRQMLYEEQAMSDAVYDAMSEGTVLVMPALDGSVYTTDGMSEYIVISEDHIWDRCIYDRSRKIRFPIANENSMECELLHATQDADLKGLIDAGATISFIYPVYLDENKIGTIKRQFRQTDELEYKHKGWTVRRCIGVIE